MFGHENAKRMKRGFGATWLPFNEYERTKRELSVYGFLSVCPQSNGPSCAYGMRGQYRKEFGKEKTQAGGIDSWFIYLIPCENICTIRVSFDRFHCPLPHFAWQV